jgi:putative toxin-antitoxin system antitoxin component (TIGR02293 family)
MAGAQKAKEVAETTADIERYLELMRGEGGQNVYYSYLSLLGLPQLDMQGLIKRVEQGFTFNTLLRFQRNVALPMREISEWLQIPLTTLNRRREQGRLHPDESDRILRATRVFGKALELFEGDAEAARRWLSSPQPGLGGAVPLTISKTDLGAREVEDLIDRLEYGVFT